MPPDDVKNGPPGGMPCYRLLTGPDDAVFCRRVSEMLDLGYRLHGSPAATWDGRSVIVAQAVLWPDAAQPPVRDGGAARRS